MDNKIVRQIIEDAAKLAEQSVSAFEAEKRLKEIEPVFTETVKKAELLEKTASELKESFRSGLNKIANVLVTRGILEDANKVSFVNAISEDPSEIFNVVEKIAGELKAESFGGPGSLPASAELDPFERLAMGE
jgi:hypothetical protein